MRTVTEMELRVAAALNAAMDAWLEQAGDAKDGLQEEPEYTLYVALAQGAIRALREPTEAMKTCSDEIHWGYGCATCGGLTEGWYTLIDAASPPDTIEPTPPHSTP